MIRFAFNLISTISAGLIAAVLLLSTASPPLPAQSTSIRLTGSVWDPSGDPLPGAILTAVEQNSGRQYETVSNEEGYYVFLALQPGVYTVTAKAKEFKDVIHRGIQLFLPGTTEENFAFEVSAIDKEIGPRELPRVYDSGTSLSITPYNLEAVPLMERNPLPFLVYQPGIQINTANEGYSSVNGTRPAMNAIKMDGLSIRDPIKPGLGVSIPPVNPESIYGIQLFTTGAKAEYGGSAGAQIMLSSRAGSKFWTGEIYDSFRSRVLNANDFFNNARNYPRPGFARNIYGLTLSGPVADRNVIFVNFEGNRTDQQLIRNRLVLTESARTGIFRWYTPGEPREDAHLNSFNIAANDPRGLGIDPSIAALLSKLPKPNNNEIGDGLNTAGFRFDNPVKNRQERVTIRLDRDINKKHHLFLRVNWNRTNATDIWNSADAPFAGQPEGTLVQNYWGLVAGLDYSFGPTRVNELRVGFSQPKTELNRAGRLASAMLLANSWTNPLDPSFPRSYGSPVFEIADHFSSWKNSHVLKLGLTFRRTVLNSTDYYGAFPNVTFGINYGNAPAFNIGPSEQSQISSEDRLCYEALYNDLLGRIESVTQTFNSNLTSVLPGGTPRSRSYALHEYAFYVQDDFRIRPNLILNLGLRYELGAIPKERNGLQAVLNQISQISSSANISEFTISPGSKWYSRSFKDFAPRAGFAWDIFHSGRTVLRGSYGVFYDRLPGAVINFMDKNSYGFSRTVTIYPNAAGTDWRLRDGIPTITPPNAPLLKPAVNRASSIAVFDPNIETPRVDHFNLTIEKKLWGAVFEASYAGTRGKRLFQYVDWNQTKTQEDFLEAFKQLQAYREFGTRVPASNTLVKIFGTPLAAFNALGGSIFDTGQAGAAANTLDRTYYHRYSAAGVSDFYLRNFPQFDRFIVGTSMGRSWYDSLQLGMRASGNSYHLRANYTYSKSEDTISSDGEDFVSLYDSFEPLLNKAPSDFDRTHVVNVVWEYKIPFGKSRNIDSEISRWVDAAFGNWNLTFLFLKASGARFSVSSDRETLYGGVTSLANYNGSTPKIGRIYHLSNGLYWLSSEETKHFAYPAAGEAGNSGRNAFVGPGYTNFDLALYKSFPVRERRHIQLRIEIFNLFNSPQFGLPDAHLSSATFGRITSTVGTPRSLQVGLRFQF